MDRQLSFASLDFASKKKRTKRDVFLAEMAAVVPWPMLEAIIEPYYPKVGPRTQAGGRARTFRRAGMARLPPSRHSLHRGLRIPDLRAGDDSPLNRSCRHAFPATCPMRRLPAQRIRRCGLNATSQTRSQRCDGDWWLLSPQRYRAAHAAPLQPRVGTDIKICDTVRLGPASANAWARLRRCGGARLSPLPFEHRDRCRGQSVTIELAGAGKLDNPYRYKLDHEPVSSKCLSGEFLNHINHL